MDLLAEDTEVEVPPRTPTPRAGPAAGLDRAAVLLGRAARPAIVAGDGVGRDDAVRALVRVAETCGAPVHHQPMADCLDFPTTHPHVVDDGSGFLTGQTLDVAGGSAYL
ncbi:hypothetical protein [Streptomyces sp. NPDC060027]|uniref:hypothetical protein n=1 Tax=Streptomyces sp. NPDC060027 TaxID=3347040 RepID=UPI00368DED42